MIAWLGFIGVLGLPSVVVPIGRTARRAPGRHADRRPVPHDYRAIRAAELMAEVLGGYSRRRASEAELLMWTHMKVTRWGRTP